MRIATTLGTILLLAGAGGAAAALAPEYQRAAEIAAVVNAVAANGSMVDGVERVEVDLYRVRAGGCTVDARIVDMPAEPGSPPMPGPRQFDVGLDAPNC